MVSLKLEPLPSLEDFPVEERTETVKFLLGICHRQQEQLIRLTEVVALQAEQIQGLKDEIAILKGQKPRLRIKPSTLNKDNGGGSGEGDVDKGRKRGRPQCKKTREIEIHDERVIEPESIPEGATLKGYEDFVVQDIEIRLRNTRYRRARYDLPDGGSIIGALPSAVEHSHFGPTLQSYILSQAYQQHVPQRLLLKQLWEFGVRISSGELNRIITEGHERFHEEKAAVLREGLSVSSHVNVDDTVARHQGKNGYCTHIGNEFFASFSSTESKSRINFLELLRAEHTEYTLNDAARTYMEHQNFPRAELDRLGTDQVFSTKGSFEEYLRSREITDERHKRILTEGALVGTLVGTGLSEQLVIVSDDAGQFKIAGFLHALCWVHAERTINTIIPYSDEHRAAQAKVEDELWTFYRSLKDFKVSPSEQAKRSLSNRFDEIFTQKTSFQMLNLALKRIQANKDELLLVLERPEIPLHNNLSENDIRDYVKKRKISATTRSDEGRRARDTFLSLKKTCQKLGISFWAFLKDRISGANAIPPLPSLIRLAAQGP